MLAQLLFERLARLLERLTAGWCDANRGQRPVSRLPELLSGVERDEGFRRRACCCRFVNRTDPTQVDWKRWIPIAERRRIAVPDTRAQGCDLLLPRAPRPRLGTRTHE